MGPFLHSLKKPSQRETAPAGHMSPDTRRRRRRALAVLLALVVVVVVVLATPAGRRQLRESFTQAPVSYTELYFTSPPVVSHAQVTVPVSVVRHGAGPRIYHVRVWLESPGGRTTASTTARLTPGTTGPMMARVRLPLRYGAQIVHVALLGHPRTTLHFQLGARTAPTAPLAPTAPTAPTPQGTP